ncbi:MAG: 16S rRNA (cytidine(1402)-2'-O)-methyltransferase [Patescibacteria group bacterium]|jgi:16S rRNA (cytidine1402-2'-O)-methyltransferase
MNLYIVATPLGNLKDITLRALETLKSVPLIACEDTRVSGKLLAAYDIKTKTISYHQHSSAGKVDFLLDKLAEAGEMAVITDAGTPGISDPGNLLVEAAVKRFGDKCRIIPIPGPSAIIALLSISGLPTDRFVFLGFLPHKKGKETALKKIINSEETVIFYESTHRIIKSLEKLNELMALGGESDRRIVVGRELTKKFETVYRGNIKQILDQLRSDTAKGEFVAVVEGKK